MTDRRILLGASSFADAAAAIGIAIDLATRTGSALHGVFIEDDILFRVGRETTIIVAADGSRLTLTRGMMERACLDDAAAFERALSVAAGRSGLDFSFEVRRGGFPSALVQTARAGDFVLLGHRKLVAPGKSIVLVTDGSPDQGITHDLAKALATARGEPLHVIALGATATASDDVLAMLESRNPVAVVVAVESPNLHDPSAFLEAARAPVLFAM